jgi:hypothetical protein
MGARVVSVKRRGLGAGEGAGEGATEGDVFWDIIPNIKNDETRSLSISIVVIDSVV